jgi:hypothetical protein
MVEDILLKENLAFYRTVGNLFLAVRDAHVAGLIVSASYSC